jgi:hypothetical protein
MAIAAFSKEICPVSWIEERDPAGGFKASRAKNENDDKRTIGD